MYSKKSKITKILDSKGTDYFSSAGWNPLKGSVRYFWCWTYVKWGYLKFHPLKGFVSTIIRSACRSQNVVLPLTRSPWEPFFPLFFPLIAIPYELEIFPLNMLNGAISNFTPSKDFFLRCCCCSPPPFQPGSSCRPSPSSSTSVSLSPRKAAAATGSS